jgi:NadR type nicotinamide-nucleotide adenylyltransferase
MAPRSGEAIMKRICLHGPESTGKSTLAKQLATHFGCEVVPEYGRAYCEAHGTDIDMAALVHIGQSQDAMNCAAAARGGELVLFDTDPLMTAVWAEMMFGKRDAWFEDFSGYSDLYLLLDIDLPFVDDGLRVYGNPAARRRFFDLCRAELSAHRVNSVLISGQGDTRFINALEAIERMMA